MDEGGDEAAWDFCWLGDALLPGIASLEVTKTRSVDVKKSRGTDGATLSDDGYEPARVTVRLRMWTAEQWAAYQDLLPQIDPQRPGGLREPVAIVHPEVNVRGIDTVYVTSISGSSPERGGAKVETIECIQWFPQPKPAKSRQEPKAPEPQFGPPPPPDPGTLLA
jgi:hypothetical protein